MDRHFRKWHLNSVLRKQHVLCWPDRARSHYALEVQQYSKKNGVQLVPEQKNPQNFPQARPVDTFWSILELVCNGGWEGKNIDQLQRRIKRKLKEIDINIVCKNHVFEHTKTTSTDRSRRAIWRLLFLIC